MMDPITSTTATALVGAMATDAWQQVRTAVVAWCRRSRPEAAELVDTAFTQSRERVLTARGARDERGEALVVADWQLRLAALLREDRVLAEGLRRLLDEEIAPLLALTLADRANTPPAPQELRAEASGHGRVYQAGRDQKIVES
ncbi:hypothetical protein [Streptomyces hokutonensis]|uniref:hypothetical protein n=1 Tax=Streptomyces hokutonensis TaxID=1306990 RepID=UPI00035E9ED9|nr:hypothetical protein [Streptomyces hokutonensis]